MTAAGSRRGSLAWRVRLALWGASAICIAATAVLFYVYWSHHTLDLRTSELRRQVSVIAAGVSVSDAIPGSPEDPDGSHARLLRVEAGLISAHLAVADGSGKVLFTTAGAAGLRSYPFSKLTSGATAFEARTGVISLPNVGDVLVVAVPVAFAQPDEPSRYLVGARTLSDIGAADAWVTVAIVVAAALALVLAWALGALLTRRIAGPLQRLTDGARDIAAGQWGRQVPVAGDVETAELAAAFNDMSARIEAVYRAQQEFVADVSHEIRTPVTSILGFAGAIADGTLADDAGVKRAAGIISSEAVRLNEITATLLALADLDSGVVPVTLEPIDAAALATDLRNRFELIARDKGVVLTIDLSAGTRSPLADPDRMMQALSILIENAIRHARSRVIVGSQALSLAWEVHVDDDGPGIPAAERERVFRRFTQLDPSRTSGRSGLGLAICKRLVEMMGGSVRVDDAPGLGGARFVVAQGYAPTDGTGSTRTQHGHNFQTTRGADSSSDGDEPVVR